MVLVLRFVCFIPLLFPFFAIGQNPLLPAKYYTYVYATDKVNELDSFTDVLCNSTFINDSAKRLIKTQIKQKKLHCYLDILAQCENVKTYYNDPNILDCKKDFLQKINQVRKFAPLKDLDSVWYEYFRDTLNGAEYVHQYSGFKLCMKNSDTIVRERIYIPINNNGQFYKNHYNGYTIGEYVCKVLNKYLAVTKSDYRFCFETNPIFFHPVTDKIQEDDGLALILMNKHQTTFFKSIDENSFKFFYTHFDDYNSNGQKAADIKHIINSNMLWPFDEPTQRSIIRKMNETYFENFGRMIPYSHINTSHISMQWGVYPAQYKGLVSDLVKNCRNKFQAQVLYDGYPTCKKDSFLFKVEINHKIYSGKYKCGSELDVKFLKLLYEIAHDGFADRTMYLSSINQVDFFYVLLKEDEKDYIIKNSVFYLYDITKF